MRGLIAVATLLSVLVGFTEAFRHGQHRSKFNHDVKDKMLRFPLRQRPSSVDIKLNVKLDLNNDDGDSWAAAKEFLNNEEPLGPTKAPRVQLPDRRPPVPSEIHEIAQQINTPAELPATNSSMLVLRTTTDNTTAVANFTTFGTTDGMERRTLIPGDVGTDKEQSVHFHRPHRRVQWSASNGGRRKHRGGSGATVIKLAIPIFIGGDASDSSIEANQADSSSEKDSSVSDNSRKNVSTQKEEGKPAPKHNSGRKPPPHGLPINSIEQLIAVLSASMLGENAVNNFYVSDVQPANLTGPETETTSSPAFIPISSEIVTNTSSSSATDVLLAVPPTNAIIPTENDPINALMPVEGADIMPEAMATVDNSTTVAPPRRVEVMSTTRATVSSTTVNRDNEYDFGEQKKKPRTEIV